MVLIKSSENRKVGRFKALYEKILCKKKTKQHSDEAKQCSAFIL